MAENLFDGRPSEAGFYMPAEWHPHDCTWVSWPHNRDTWSRNLEEAQREFVRLVSKIAIDEPVIVLIPDDDQADCFVQAMLKFGNQNQQQNVWTNHVPTNDAWARDYGPTFVIGNEQVMAIDWQYNAWGGKYPPFDDDQKVVQRGLKQLPSFASKHSPVLRKTSQLCIEGGALEIDENRVLMCTRSCALDAKRNPGWTLDQIETELKNCLGAKHVIWLDGDAIAGDDTDGHIDQLARFAPNQKIIHAISNQQSDPQSPALEQNLEQLKSNIESTQTNYELVPLPLPPPITFESMRLPASYCNFYITNKSVFVPQFGHRDSDQRALEIIDDLFPSRQVIGLDSYHLTVGLGSFHCLTQQQPSIV